jgi:hypothetical protein
LIELDFKEIVDLTWQKLDLTANTIWIKGKGRKELLLPFTLLFFVFSTLPFNIKGVSIASY